MFRCSFVLSSSFLSSRWIFEMFLCVRTSIYFSLGRNSLRSASKCKINSSTQFDSNLFPPKLSTMERDTFLFVSEVRRNFLPDPKDELDDEHLQTNILSFVRRVHVRNAGFLERCLLFQHFLVEVEHDFRVESLLFVDQSFAERLCQRTKSKKSRERFYLICFYFEFSFVRRLKNVQMLRPIGAAFFFFGMSSNQFGFFL